MISLPLNKKCTASPPENNDPAQPQRELCGQQMHMEEIVGVGQLEKHVMQLCNGFVHHLHISVLLGRKTSSQAESYLNKSYVCQQDWIMIQSKQGLFLTICCRDKAFLGRLFDRQINDRSVGQ
jgi:hypothetical protein